MPGSIVVNAGTLHGVSGRPSHRVEGAGDELSRTAVDAPGVPGRHGTVAFAALGHLPGDLAVGGAVHEVDLLDASQQVVLGEVGLGLDQRPHGHADQGEAVETILEGLRAPAAARGRWWSATVVRCRMGLIIELIAY